MKAHRPPTSVAVPFAILAIALSGCSSLSEKSSGIGSKAEAILQNSSMTLARAKAFSFRVKRDVPSVIAEAAGMRETADIRLAVQRPNQVAAVDSGGGNEHRFYYDGSRITRINGTGSNYAVADAPATIDEMITFIDQEWGMRPPLAGLLLSKPLDSAVKKSRGGALLGEEPVDGEPCHRLNFVGDGVIWDFWVSTRDHLPRRFDVTVTELEGSPRGSTKISEWNLKPKFPPSQFRASVPAGFTKRKMEEML